MSKQFYDDFSKLPLDKMAQEMENITYLYKETKVPKKHYKEALSKGYEEMVEASVSVNLVNTIYTTLSALQKESPKLFYEALLSLDMGVKPSNITPAQYQAMEHTYSQYEQAKPKHMLDSCFTDIFTDVLENGLVFKAKQN